MISTFIGVVCPCGLPVHSLCVTEQCRISPFICEQGQDCRNNHLGNCCIKSIEQIDKDIKTILKFQFFIVYSHEFKGKSVHVAGRFALQTRSPVINQRFALTFEPIPILAEESVSFRLTRIKGCVGIGIFIREVIQKNQYRYVPDNNFLGHGCYMLLSNNLLYSHSRLEQNGRSISKYQVSQGDIIKVKYNKGKLSFIYKFLQQSINVDTRVGQNLHFGVYLYDVQDEVQIVNPFVAGGV